MESVARQWRAMVRVSKSVYLYVSVILHLRTHMNSVLSAWEDSMHIQVCRGLDALTVTSLQ